MKSVMVLLFLEMCQARLAHYSVTETATDLGGNNGVQILLNQSLVSLIAVDGFWFG